MVLCLGGPRVCPRLGQKEGVWAHLCPGRFWVLFSNPSGVSLKQKLIGASSHLKVNPVFIKTGSHF